MSSRRILLLCVLLGALVFSWLRWKGPLSRYHRAEITAPIIEKQPTNFARRIFNPSAPPPDMPPLAYGEAAECDSDFLSHATVGGELRRIDSTRATVTVTQVNVNLQLNGTIWVPIGASQRIIDHEEGHRQISEHYYQRADTIAQQIAASYLGRQVEISGPDLSSQFSQTLQQQASQITDEYKRELNPDAAQQYYDMITDHGRSDLAANGAVAAALQNVPTPAIPPGSNSTN